MTSWAATMPKVQYRVATLEDVETLVTLRRAFLFEVDGAEKKPEALSKAMREYFTAAIPTGEYIGIVAVEQGEIVGTTGLVWHRYPPSGVTLTGVRAHILNVYVVPPRRGSGIGSRLVREAVEAARKRGCSRVTLHAVPVARLMYERIGFVETNSEMRMEL